MMPQDILAITPNVLTQQQRADYFRDGFLVAHDLIEPSWLERIRAVTAERIEASREVTQSNDDFDLGPDHCPQHPQVRRLRKVVDQHPEYWEFASNSVITSCVADLVGPDVKFHSAKLNLKYEGGGAAVAWHQDIPAWPHTNYSPLTVGIYLEDVDAQQGPLAMLPGSHLGPLYDHYPNGKWTGYVPEHNCRELDLSAAVSAVGPAGTVVIVNCRTVHGSAANLSDKPRSLLLYVYSAADAFTYSAAPTPTRYTGQIVRGRAARWAHVDPRPGRVPPEWDKIGYGSIFSAQQMGEDD